jgi:hypothetical protein
MLTSPGAVSLVPRLRVSARRHIASAALSRPHFLAIASSSRGRNAPSSGLHRPLGRAWQSTAINPAAATATNAITDSAAAVNESGHITVKSNESVLFFDSKSHKTADPTLCRYSFTNASPQTYFL